MDVKDWVFSHKICSHFNDPPVSDDDLEFIESWWVFCEYEDRCQEKDSCPVLPDSPMFPRIIKDGERE
ncbi:hypothetical protein LCGC14_0535490 [marine sediment metagenome]|uniref:Uncharacterized protein n=1 Tax=marine sediment metagenome TaxID=412755 RepID=A0A0F9RUD3_9ZZZZ